MHCLCHMQLLFNYYILSYFWHDIHNNYVYLIYTFPSKLSWYISSQVYKISAYMYTANAWSIPYGAPGAGWLHVAGQTEVVLYYPGTPAHQCHPLYDLPPCPTAHHPTTTITTWPHNYLSNYKESIHKLLRTRGSFPKRDICSWMKNNYYTFIQNLMLLIPVIKNILICCNVLTSWRNKI